MFTQTIFLGLLLSANAVVQCLASLSSPFPSLSKDDTRTSFKDLIATNPNYFGNLPNSDKPIVSPLSYDTQYEQLIAIGFNPVLNVLEATIEIKLSYGFLGDLCTNGSWEYVRFYANYGEGWENLGAVSVNIHDIPDVFDCEKKSEKPLFYVLTKAFQPPQENCEIPLIPEIRGILSWNNLPPAGSPFWAPVYGNVLDQHIQPSNVSLPLPTSEENTLALKSPELFEYHPSSRNEQRVLSIDQSSIPSVDSRPGEPANLRYEQLIGLGFDYDLSRLVATIRIKQPVGYGTNLCGPGSLEHVAFWADWENTCNWTYLGELTINVHSIAKIPLDGLTYSVALPVDVRSASRPCNITKIARVQAAVSWNSSPPTPPNEAQRGNFIEAHVQLPPYTPPVNSTNPVIFSIGGIIPQNIDVKGNGMTLPNATFALVQDGNGDPIYTDPWWPQQRRPCPFGGDIYITGPSVGQTGSGINAPSQFQYRAVYRHFGDTSEGLPILNRFTVGDLGNSNPPPPLAPFTNLLSPLNGLGYFYYVSPEHNIQSLLSRWTPPDRDLYQIRLEVAIQTSPSPTVNPTYDTIGLTEWYNVQVNNVANPNGPTGDVAFTNEPICGTFPVGTVLEGTFWATSEYFYQYELDVVGGIPHTTLVDGGAMTNPGPFEVAGPPSPGVGWSLITSGSTPCGYVVVLTVWDLTIYDSINTGRYSTPFTRGFCLSPAT